MRRLIFGEAGPAPAWVLAGMAVVIAFIAAAGPRALVSADNRATRQAVAQAPALDAGALVSADLQAAPGTGVLSAATIAVLARAFAARLPLPDLFPPAPRWAGVTVPSLVVENPAPSALSDLPPTMEVAYRSGLARNCVVVAGSLPAGQALVRPAAGRHPGSVMLPVAVSQAVAARFSLRIGSLVSLGSAAPGGLGIWLRVAGIFRPTAPASSFWQYEPLLGAPTLAGSASDNSLTWQGGVFAGPGDLAALAAGYAGDTERAGWFFPLRANLTAAQVSELESGLAAMATTPATRIAEVRSGASVLRHTAVTTGLADGLAVFSAQWQSTAGADSILIAGLFIAAMVLLLICCGLAVQAYQSELTLLRVRGGSLTQLAGRMFLRSCIVMLPAFAVGAAIAVAVLPGSGSATGTILVGVAAATAAGATPVIAAGAHRRLRPADAGRRRELIAGRSAPRRLAAEVLIVLVASAAIADLRLRGAIAGAGAGAPGAPVTLSGAAPPASTAAYLSASAVLITAVVGLLLSRTYRGPLRVLARAASLRRGPVAPVGLARAATLPASSVLPALVLMLTLTLTAFSAMVQTSVAAGQLAASWAQTGADAVIAAGASGTARPSVGPGVTARDLRVIGRVRGVEHVAAVYLAPDQGPLAVSLRSGRSLIAPLGLAVVDPASYAALAAGTPWPGFPAAALARPPARGTGVVPILVTPGVAAAAGKASLAGAVAAGRGGTGGKPGSLALEFGGIDLPVRIVGTVTATAAMPAGGSYVVLPAWAAPHLPSIPPPSTVLATGPAISVAALRAAVDHVLPGSQLTLRRQVLGELAGAPALQLSTWLYRTGALAAAVLGALAVLFALATAARGRAVMMTRLAALGMPRSQALVLTLTDALPLLCVAIAGTAAASWLLAELVGPVLGLSVFTGSVVPVLLRPTWPALVVPFAGATILALAFLAIDGAASGRRAVGAALRQEETG